MHSISKSSKEAEYLFSWPDVADLILHYNKVPWTHMSILQHVASAGTRGTTMITNDYRSIHARFSIIGPAQEWNPLLLEI